MPMQKKNVSQTARKNTRVPSKRVASPKKSRGKIVEANTRNTKSVSQTKRKTISASKTKKEVNGSFPQQTFYPYTRERHDDLEWQTKRFRKSISSFSDAQRELTEKAFAFAADRHKTDTRANGSPYIIHPLRIANILMDEWGETRADVVAASLLHDVVEDTATTIREVRDLFGEDVGKLIDGITMWKGSETHDVYLKRIARSSEPLRLIKCADTLDNMRSWHEITDESFDKFPRWWRQTKDIVLPMAKKTCAPCAKMLHSMVEDTWYLERAKMI